MSSPSLQEQLQALVSPTTAVTKSTEACSADSPSPLAKQERFSQKKPQQIKPPQLKQNTQKPAWLEYMYYGIELLKAYYPHCFKEMNEIKPLKVGIKQDLVKHLSTQDQIVINDKSCMIKSLSYYVTTIHYYKAVQSGVHRIDLDGNPAGEVTAEEANYSAEQHKMKLQKKNQRPKPNTP